MSDQKFKTVKEQIEILRKRGLTISNEAQAEKTARAREASVLSASQNSLAKNLVELLLQSSRFCFSSELSYSLAYYIDSSGIVF
ncbi:MAG: hypothetical protein K6G50_00255 [bacterium]|nr:hypothetical protein [bacterium]